MLIITFPSLKVDIELYPAVKEYLLSFGYDRLKQTGDKGSRKKTNNQWFETQDTIGYWEDFYKKKIVWTDIATMPSFVYIEDAAFFNNTCYMMTNAPHSIIGFLNSKVMKWYFPKIASGLGAEGARYFKQFVELIPIPKITNKVIHQQIQQLLDINCESEINNMLYQFYNFTSEEISFIETQ